MRKLAIQSVLLVLLLGVASAMAELPKVPRLEFSDQRLENGLRVLIAPDHSAPVFAISDHL